MAVLQSTTNHQLVLSTVLNQLGVSQPDWCFKSREGHSVFTNMFLVGFHSKLVKEIFKNVPHTKLAYLSLPVSSSALSCLLKLLSHGATESEDRFDPLEVITAAEVLGIDREDVQVGVKKGKTNIVDETKQRKNDNVLVQSNYAQNGLKKEITENLTNEDIGTETFVMEVIESSSLIPERQIEDGKVQMCARL